MTVDLPPPLPPAFVDAGAIRDQRELGIVRYGAYRVHLLGPEVLDLDALTAIVTEAETLSNAVRALSRAYYDAGYPGAQLYYALLGEDLYVAVDLGELAAVEAPEALAPYFDDLPRGEPLTDGEFERRRALAAAYAERARLYGDTQIVPQGRARSLQISAHETDARATRGEIAFSNPGNRFVGRHFADLEVTHVRDSGDEFNLLWSVGLTDLDEDARTDEYYDETLTWSRVTPHGLFGLTGHVVDYKQPLSTVTVDGDLEEIQALWSYPLAASFASRWILDVRADYTRKRRSAPGLGASAQDERYPSAEVGNTLSHTAIWLGLPWDFETGLTLRKGLRSQTTAYGADLDYLVWRPSARADATLGERASAGLAIAAQLTSDTTPEQSQWVLGGSNAIYAYLPGVAVGDSGGLALLQFEYRLPTAEDIGLRTRAFAEYGYARYEGSAPTGAAQRVELADVGLEISARYKRWLEASLAGAVPILDDDLDAAVRSDGDAGLLFRVALSF